MYNLEELFTGNVKIVPVISMSAKGTHRPFTIVSQSDLSLLFTV